MNDTEMEAEEATAIAALMEARRARLRLGRVEVREPPRPAPKRPEPVTLAEIAFVLREASGR